ncbi:PREDICTED: acylphosphatase-1-like [Lipotes vexillifer]|uniref:acylphosphatase n=1 Tax=Lipotes vexillifer TaxID=118797 RepID=A0A340X3T8_LIPVE|nr:PREDICTED: acylphosphatase-1-like [Lipotes vexillifer]
MLNKEARKEDREGLSIAEGDALISVDCDILGEVLGVMVHEYTQVEGKKLGLGGWIQSTDWNTVQGQLQGPISEVRHPQEMLETRGGLRSHTDRASFNSEKVILKSDCSAFQIVK